MVLGLSTGEETGLCTAVPKAGLRLWLLLRVYPHLLWFTP